MKHLLFFIVLITFSGTAPAQDYITKKDGENIKAKVPSVANGSISYQLFDNNSGATYSIPVSKVVMIVYQDGKKEVFTGRHAHIKGKIFPSGYLALHGGVAIPIETFASTGRNIISAGYAQSGYSGFAEFAIPFGKSVSTIFTGFPFGVALTGNEKKSSL